ncbi:MAG: cytochrome c oxidase subunit II [Comamonadaceae bacterium]|nr:MAG: cytochrome c oxidase subunit II [Comamonadaceae bacterium]
MTEFDFRWMLMVACLMIFVASFAALLWASWKHHRGGSPERVNFHSSLAVEIAWTVTPCVIVLLLVWPTARIFWTP